MPSDMAYRKCFGSWGKALKECGFISKKSFPSQKCKEAVSRAKKGKFGKLASNWKGGRRKEKNTGYILIWSSEEQRYLREHRVIMEKHLGRKLREFEEVHHINRIKDDNRIENLMLLTKSEHIKLHDKEDTYTRKNKKQCVFPNCNQMTSSKYCLCKKHYKLQWSRLREGLIKNYYDFSFVKKVSEETKKKLSEYAKKQPRFNGKFGNIYTTPELLEGKE